MFVQKFEIHVSVLFLLKVVEQQLKLEQQREAELDMLYR